MVGVGYYNRSRSSATGDVDNSVVLLGVLDESFYGCGIGSCDRNYAVCGNHIAKADVYKFHCLFPLLYVLNLLANLFKLTLHIDDYARDTGVVAFRADGVRFAIELLHKKIELTS